VNLNLDYEPAWVIATGFITLAVLVGLGIVLIRDLFDDIEGKFETLKQIIESVLDVFRK
jgi:hypothetical protein